MKHLIPNDIICLEAGQVIPVDGILKEFGWLYTTRINGSPELKRFEIGDPVKAGMCLASQHPDIQVSVSKTYQNSYLSLVAKNIRQSNDEKAPIEMFANKVLQYFIPALTITAITFGIVIGLIFNYVLAIQVVLSFLVSACPCVLSLITPMAVKIGMKKASERGIHFKDGKALQSAADIHAVVFDLNGTLTEGKPSVTELTIQDENLLKSILALEERSDHPVAKRIIEYIKAQGITADDNLTVSNIDKTNHCGIKGEIAGQTLLIGNITMLRSNGIQNLESDDPSTIYIVYGSELKGTMKIEDQCKHRFFLRRVSTK